VESELHFEWPGAPGHERQSTPSPEWRPLSRHAEERRAPASRPDGDLLQQLHDARATIDRLEADRHVARVHIDELEAANDILQARVTAQRRQLLVLERQLEAADIEPARELPTRASWLDRLFGGPTSVATG